MYALFYMEYLIIYDVRYFTVHFFNGSENTIFISLTCDIFYFYIDALIKIPTH